MRYGLRALAGVGVVWALFSVPTIGQEMQPPSVEQLAALIHDADAANLGSTEFTEVHVVKLEAVEGADTEGLKQAVMENQDPIDTIQEALKASAMKDQILDALKGAYGAEIGADAPDDAFFALIVAAEVKDTPKHAVQLILYAHPKDYPG